MQRISVYKFLLVLTMLAYPFTGRSQNTLPVDTLLDRLKGKWVLKGMIAGKKIEHDITAEWVLGNQYLQIKEVSREQNANGLLVYDAIVYLTFNRAQDEYDCLWLDNTSNAGLSNGIIAHAKKAPDQLALLFKFNNHSFFHTILSYDAAQTSWAWVMDSEENGKTENFAKAVMRKTP